MNDSGLKVNQSLYYLEAYLTPLVCVCTCLECATKHITLPFMIKVLCEQTRELTDDLHDFWIIFNVIWFREFCGWLSYLEYEQ